MSFAESTLNNLQSQITNPLETGSEKGELLGRDLFGQSSEQTGQDIQDIIQKRQGMLNGVDPMSSQIRNSANDQLRAQNMGGGQRLTPEQQLQARRNTESQAQMSQAGYNQQNLNAYQKLIGNVAAQQQGMGLGYSSLAVGQAAPQYPQAGMMGTVICTELASQGYLNEEIMKKDELYGMKIKCENPAIYIGYRIMADPIVRGMKKSKSLTWIVSLFAIPWAFDMSGESNLVGRMVTLFGEPLCWLVAKISGRKSI